MRLQQTKTLEEANALIPELDRIVGRQLSRRKTIERHLSELAVELGQEPDDLTLQPNDTTNVRDRKETISREISEYEGGWKELESIGAVLKDPRQGLIDFYGELDGETVWLCWKYGEESISHYHKRHEGFSHRRPIDAAAKKKLLN